jgi:hypothetical protein
MVYTSVGQFLLILENHQFWFFMGMCENHFGSYFFLNRGLTRIVSGIKKIPRKKMILKLGGSQQFGSHKLDLKNFNIFWKSFFTFFWTK